MDSGDAGSQWDARQRLIACIGAGTGVWVCSPKTDSAGISAKFAARGGDVDLGSVGDFGHRGSHRV